MRTRSIKFGVLMSAIAELTISGKVAADAQPIPFDLAFARKSISDADVIAISPDGRRVAYAVRTPTPEGSSVQDRQLMEQQRASQQLSFTEFGQTLFVKDLTADRETRIGAPQGRCWKPAFSDEARKIAFYCDTGDGAQLWVHDLANGTSHRVSEVRAKALPWAGDGPIWSKDSREIFIGAVTQTSSASPNQRSAKPEQSTTPRVKVERSGFDADAKAETEVVPPRSTGKYGAALLAIDVASGRQRTVVAADVEPTFSVAQISPSGKWLSYMSSPRLARAGDNEQVLDVAVVRTTGGAPQVLARDVKQSLNAYLLGNYIWHPQRDQLIWVKDDRLWTAEPGETSASARQLATTLTTLTKDPLAVTRDGSAVLVGLDSIESPTAYRERAPAAVALVPLDGTAPVRFDLPAGLRLDRAITQQGATLWQPDAKSFALLAYEAAPARAAVLKCEIANRKCVTTWSGTAQLEIAGAPADHSAPYATFESFGAYKNLYRFDRDLRKKTRVTDVENRVAKYELGTVETFETAIPLPDGSTRKVVSSIALPAGAKRGDRLPTIVFVYPRSEASHRTALNWGGGDGATMPLPVFTTRGYAVLVTEIPVAPQGGKSEFIQDLTAQVLAQVYQAAALGYSDIERLAVSGQSFGGYSTAAILTGTRVFRAGIAFAGIYDLVSVASTLEPGHPLITANWNLPAHPWLDMGRHVENSPLHRADRIRTPLLLIHGVDDATCKIEEARKMFGALRHLGRTVELAEYDGESHVPSEWALANSADAARRMVDFMDTFVRK